MNEIYQKLTKIFREVFDDDDIVAVPDLSAETVDEWDSLSHIRLMVTVEEQFKISFTTAEINSFKNVGELVAAIQIKTAK